ncbi:unnamed protein product [Rhizoctonia solani]|uniref:HTH CENPB-type domain-containing protein n=1 Tax=Rhizoctonia solani TaxID=456999 RepID=A0A8H3GNL4_9AGAM|nr:unnamed protein product [Rhizoctonia solani]
MPVLTNLLPPVHKYRSACKRRISAAPDRPTKPPKAQNLTNYDKLRIINLIYRKPPGTSVYRMIPLLRQLGYATIVASTLSRLLKNEAKIRAYVQLNPQRLYEKRPPILTLPDVDKAVSQWVVQKLSNPRTRLNGDMIREKAREFSCLLGYPENVLKFSNGCLERFKVRLGLSQHCFHGEAASAPVERIDNERYRLLAIIVLYPPWDVYNVDETALLFCFVPTTGLAFKNMLRVKIDKKRLTYMLCANMDGSNKRPPLVIGRAKQPRCFEGRSAESMKFYYFWNSKAWMVYSIWSMFLYHLNEDMRRQNRYILLLCDNAPSHKHNPADYPHVRVEFLAPNLTAWIQPMDGVPQYHNPLPPPPPPLFDLFAPIVHAAYQPYAHPLPPAPLDPNIPTQHPQQVDLYINHEAEVAFDWVHRELVTEDTWTDQEIVEQLIREREEGLLHEENDDLDLEDFYIYQNNYSNQHI